MNKRRLVVLFSMLVGFISQGQSFRTASAQLTATIVSVDDTTAFVSKLRAESSTAKVLKTAPLVQKVPKILISEKDSIRLMKKYLRKKKRIFNINKGYSSN